MLIKSCKQSFIGLNHAPLAAIVMILLFMGSVEPFLKVLPIALPILTRIFSPKTLVKSKCCLLLGSLAAGLNLGLDSLNQSFFQGKESW